MNKRMMLNRWLLVAAGCGAMSAAWGKCTDPPASRADRECIAREVATLPPAITPGKVFRDCPDCPEMVVIPAGSFMMGSPSSETGRDDNEGPQHRVTIAKRFALAKTEVTQGQWRALMGNNPRENKHCGDDCPVMNVSWDNAREYLRKLSQKTGKTYRLPSEAEWEYAARAGTTTARPWGDSPNQVCDHANVGDQALKRQPPETSISREVHACSDGHANTAPVGSFRPSAFGLYDMLGNVSEWTEDCWNDSYNGAPTDGSARTSGNCKQRVVRGGSWASEPRILRSATRGRVDAAGWDSSLGFRLARTLP